MTTDPPPAPVSPDVPAWAYETITIADPDPAWADTGARLAAEVGALLVPWRITDVEHVGSTAIPGLAAKPVIDLMVPVHDLDDDGFVAALTAAGWAHVPPALDGRAWERFFVLPDGAHRRAHLHVMDPAWSWTDQLVFRDALRRDADRRDAYARLKRELAADLGDDRDGYTRAKSIFVAEVLAANRSS